MNHPSFTVRGLIGPIIAACLMLSSTVAYAAEYDDLPKTFFELVEKGDMGAAFDYLTSTNPRWDRDTNRVLRTRLVTLLGEFGAYSFHEKLDEVKFGSRYVTLTYIVGYDNFPLEIKITLYRPKDKWVLFGFVFASTSDGAFGVPSRK